MAVVVTHNRKQLLLRCLEALTAQSTGCDVLIVDNASTDGTAEALKPLLNNRVLYHNMGSNLGGAGGFHYGIRWAAEAGYDSVWVMDDDCIPMPDALEKLMEADAHLNRPYGFLSSVVLWTDGKECKMNRQKLLKSYYTDVELLKYGIIRIEQATFVSLLFPIDTIHRVGLPIKEFFIWGDDIEYTRRIAVRHGLPCYMVGQSQVVHAMQNNDGSNIAVDAPERIDRYRYAFRNEAYFYRQEGFMSICYYLAKYGLNLLRILFMAKNNKTKRAAVLFKGFFQGLFFNPKPEYLPTSMEKKRTQ